MTAHTNLLSLIQTGYWTVQVTFEDTFPSQHTPRVYTYKTADPLIVIGSKVIVDTPSVGYKVAEVVSLDPQAKIDPDARYAYKWVVARIDDTGYKATLAREEKAQQVLLELTRQRKRSEVLAQFESTLDADSRQLYDELKDLLTIGTPVTLEHKG